MWSRSIGSKELWQLEHDSRPSAFPLQARRESHALIVKCVKLVAAPLLIRISRQAHHRQLSQIPLLIIDRLRAPRTIHHRITKRATVRRSHLAAVE